MKNGKLQLTKIFLKGLFFINTTMLMGQDFAWKGQITPDPNWGLGSNNKPDMWPTSMEIDSEGSVYVFGEIKSMGYHYDIDMGLGIIPLWQTNGSALSSPFVLKYDKNRNLVWSKVFEGMMDDCGGKLAIDNNDNVYIAATYRLPHTVNPPIDLDPGTGVVPFQPTLRTVTNEMAMILVKLDKNGNFIWGHGFDGAGNEVVSDLKIDENNVLTLATTLSGDLNFDPLGLAPAATSPYFPKKSAYIAQYDLNGVFLSSKGLISDNGALISSLEFDTQNNLYISGKYKGNCDFDLTSGINIKNSTIDTSFSVKYNAANIMEWHHTHSYIVNDIKYLAANNTIYYSGHFYNTIDADNSANVFPIISNGSSDLFVLNYNSNGSFINGFNLGGQDNDYSLNINADIAGNIYVLGTCVGIIDTDPSAQTKTLGYNKGFNDRSTFLSKYNSGLGLIWSVNLVDSGFNNGFSAPFNNYTIPYANGASLVNSGGLAIGNNLDIYVGVNKYYFAEPNILQISKFTQDPSLVWPGDANDDLIADNNDLLAIGLAYGTTGTPRADNSIDWAGKTSTPWGTTLPNGTDYNNADCNGDAIINADDTTAILQNYNQIHTQKLAPSIAGINDPTLLVDFPAGNYSNGTIITVPIKLGNTTIPVSNAYGLAFTIDYPATGFDATSVKANFNNSWMGVNNVDIVGLQKNLPANKQIDIALTRIDHTNITGNGTVCEISIRVDNLGGITALKLANVVEQFTLSKASLIDKDGVLIPINLQGDSVQIISSINDVNLEKSIAIYPNPATDNIIITATNTIKSIVITDVTGKQVYTNTGSFGSLTINLSNVDGGIYFATIQTEEGVVRKKLTVKH